MQIDDAHALVIGIARYQHVPTLRATQDAEDIAAVLQDPACCGYAPARVHVLLDEAATRAAILDALDALARATTAASTVFLYYSGHGAHASDAYYVIPVDATAASPDELARTSIAGAELSARLAAIPAGRLTLVLDCCRAAHLADAPLADAPPADAPLTDAVAPLVQGRGRAVLAASRATDAAYEMPGQRDSTLTGSLVAGLRGAAPGVGGVIRICDLFHYVQQQIAASPVDQHPVFKAELEENYPIAQLRGGAVAALVLPAAPDALTYDGYLSYCRGDAADRAWVTGVVVPYLEGLGLKLCLASRDFRLGASRVEEIEHAVTCSRYTVAIFSPAYLADAYEDYESLLAAHVAIASRAPRLIPLIRRPCPLAEHNKMTEALDVSDDTEVPAALQRLALALREPARARLASPT